MKFLNIAVILLLLSSCSGNSGSGINFNSINNPGSTTEIPPSTIETQKLVTAIQAAPAYKIETSEIELLKSEGVITDQDVLQLKAIQ